MKICLFTDILKIIPKYYLPAKKFFTIYRKDQNILMDCGEGTYGQLVRFYGRSKCDEVLANIDAIYVSHIHADHHIGIIGVLQGRKAALRNLNREHKPLKLLAPVQLYPWLSFYDRYFEEIKTEFEFISNSQLVS